MSTSSPTASSDSQTVAAGQLPSVSAITQLQIDTVEAWHRGEIQNPYQGFLSLVCQQHEFNYRLWHEEDIARSPTADDVRIAAVKRAIDKLNQQRNDMIEKLDDAITLHLQQSQVQPSPDAPINTETAGSAIDGYRLCRCDCTTTANNSIATMLMRITAPKYPLESNCANSSTADLSQSLQELIVDIQAGRKQHRTYRQMKMYNDPAASILRSTRRHRLSGARCKQISQSIALIVANTLAVMIENPDSSAESSGEPQTESDVCDEPGSNPSEARASALNRHRERRPPAWSQAGIINIDACLRCPCMIEQRMIGHRVQPTRPE